MLNALIADTSRHTPPSCTRFALLTCLSCWRHGERSGALRLTLTLFLYPPLPLLHPPLFISVSSIQLYHQQYLAKGGRNGQAQSAEKGATETIRCYG